MSLQKDRITIRTYLIALPLIVANSYWLMMNWGTTGYDSGQSFPTVVSLYFNVILCLVVLIIFNSVFRQFLANLALKDSELLAIYVMLSVASSIAGHDMLQILWPMVTYSIWFATTENEWDFFHQYIPDWLTVKDKNKLTSFYQGESNFHKWENMSVWIRPIMIWSAFIIVLTLVMLFIVILIREQWIKHEKLSYPIIQTPIAITENRSSIFKNKVLWIGLAIAGSVNLINGLHFLYPQVPSLGGYRYDLLRFFDAKPFSAIGSTPIAIYPYVVGMSFFIPVDLSFSIWFFYLFKKITWVLGSIIGLSSLPGFPFSTEQSAGAWLGIALVAIWMSRKHIVRQIKTAIKTGKRGEDDPISIRSAVIGLFLGSIFLIGFCRMAGVSLWVILLYFLLFYGISFAITRVRGELGPPTHSILCRPAMILVTSLGSRRVGIPSLTLFNFFHSFNRAYRCHPMPHLLEGFAISDRRNIINRKIFWTMLVAIIVGTLSSAWAYYTQAYVFGAALYGEQAQCHWTLNEFTAWATNPTSPNRTGIATMLIGGGFTFALMFLRHRFIWWSLHPAGYALSLGYWEINWHWFSIFISWVLKITILRFGGVRTHKQSVPFFMGLILGEFLMGGIWSLLGVIIQRPMYRFMY